MGELNCMIIRKLTIEDIQAYKNELFELLQIDFIQTYGKEAEKTLVESKLLGLKEYIKSDSAFPFGAFYEDSLVGFLWGYIVNTPFEKVFHIAYIAVEDNHKRMGIGNALIKEAEIAAQKIEEVNAIELIVGGRNVSAIQFYNKNGYLPERYIYRKTV